MNENLDINKEIRSIDERLKAINEEEKFDIDSAICEAQEKISNEDLSKVNKIKEYMNEFADTPEPKWSDLDIEFNKYCELYNKKFGKKAYIAEPSGTKEQTINAIKICLEKNEDLLDTLLYPNDDEDTINDVLY